MRDRAVAAEGVIGYRSHEILEQAAAPDSKIPELPLPIAGVAEITCKSTPQLLAALDHMNRSEDVGRTAIYATEDVRLI